MRSKVVAAVLAFFFGALGIHRFYLGQPVWGIIYLVLLPIAAVVGVIDSILLLVMPQSVFDAKYNDEATKPRRKQKKRKSRKAQPRVKKRHQVNKKTANMGRSKKKSTFKKHWSTAKKFFKDYQFKDAEKEYLEALSIYPDNADLLFDIACLYSMKENKNAAFNYIELAVNNGFDNFDEIENNPSLAYLRVQDGFWAFSKAGYQQQEKQTPELLEQLRQLDLLKSRGKLTEAQFQDERDKLMH